jgi:four helix bundle protein
VAPALIAEGFARFRRKDLIHYLEMALAELAETRNHLRDGAHNNYLGVDEFRVLWRLCFRATSAAKGLLRFHKQKHLEDPNS